MHKKIVKSSHLSLGDSIDYAQRKEFLCPQFIVAGARRRLIPYHAIPPSSLYQRCSATFAIQHPALLHFDPLPPQTPAFRSLTPMCQSNDVYLYSESDVDPGPNIVQIHDQHDPVLCPGPWKPPKLAYGLGVGGKEFVYLSDRVQVTGTCGDRVCEESMLLAPQIFVFHCHITK